MLWNERNKRIHENAIRLSREISNFIKNYLRELGGFEDRTLTRRVDMPKWEPSLGEWIKVNFDAAFDRTLFRSGSRLVAKNS